MRLCPSSVVLDLVYPFAAGRRVFAHGRETRFDEARARRRHAARDASERVLILTKSGGTIHMLESIQRLP